MPTRRQVLTKSAAVAAATVLSSPSVWGADRDSIHVAAILPLSGNFKVFGDQAQALLGVQVSQLLRLHALA